MPTNQLSLSELPLGVVGALSYTARSGIVFPLQTLLNGLIS